MKGIFISVRQEENLKESEYLKQHLLMAAVRTMWYKSDYTLLLLLR